MLEFVNSFKPEVLVNLKLWNLTENQQENVVIEGLLSKNIYSVEILSSFALNPSSLFHTNMVEFISKLLQKDSLVNLTISERNLNQSKHFYNLNRERKDMMTLKIQESMNMPSINGFKNQHDAYQITYK